MYDDTFYFYDERNAIGPSPWRPQQPGMQPDWFRRRPSGARSRDHRDPRASPAPAPAPQPPAPLPPAYPPGPTYPPMYPPGYGDPYGYGAPFAYGDPYDGGYMLPMPPMPVDAYAFNPYGWPADVVGYVVW